MKKSKKWPAVDKKNDKESPQRITWAQQSFAQSDLEQLSKETERFLEQRARMTARPRYEANIGGPLPKSGVEVLAAGRKVVKGSFGKSPTKRTSWGQTGRYVQIDSKESFASATLRFRIKAKELAHLHTSTIFVARWDQRAERFFVLPFSGYDGAGEYAYARITRPGIYTAIGLPRDPRLLTTIKLFSAASQWTGVGGKAAARLVPPICQVVLCQNFMQSLPSDSERAGEYGYGPDDFSGGYGGGDACAQCRSIDLDRFTELDVAQYVGLAHSTIDLEIGDFQYHNEPPTWSNIGPTEFTGRVTALAIHPGDGNVIYAGTSAGGVWKTANAGLLWRPMMSKERSLAIGGLGIAASRPQVLYAATGVWPGLDFDGLEPIVLGIGVLCSEDGGETWRECGFLQSRWCSAVAIDPTNHLRVFVAGNAGLHRTTDGGMTWFLIFTGNVSDVVVDPNDPERLYFGVQGDAIYRSTDGGDNFTRLTSDEHGIATDADVKAPKIALGRNDSHQSRFVVVRMGDRMFTSTNGGQSFTELREGGGAAGGEMRFNLVAVHPDDERILYRGFEVLERSTDGGEHWHGAPLSDDRAPEMRALVFDPADHDRLYLAAQDGIWTSTDRGATWTFASRGLVAEQVYQVAVSQTPTFRYGGSLLLKGSVQYEGPSDWRQLLPPGDSGGYFQYDPSNEEVIFLDSFNIHRARRSNDGGVTFTEMTLGMGYLKTDAADLLYGTPLDRTAPYRRSLTIARNNTQSILALAWTVPVQPFANDGARNIVRSTNGGASWDIISESHLFSTVRFAPSDDNDNYAYAGTQDGHIWYSGDGGANWFDLGALPLSGIVQNIVADWHHPLRIYAALSTLTHGHRHLFRGDLSVDAGQVSGVQWTDIGGPPPDSNGILPDNALPDLPIFGLALHPNLENVIYVSNGFGVLFSQDGGDSWAPFGDNLPNVFVSDLEIRVNDRALYASTMGRGIYQIYI